MSLPLAKTGVSGSEQDVCIPEPAEMLVAFPTPLLLQPPLLVPFPATLPPLPLEEQGSAEGECRFENGLRREGPGRSVGKVRRSTGICCKRSIPLEKVVISIISFIYHRGTLT